MPVHSLRCWLMLGIALCAGCAAGRQFPAPEIHRAARLIDLAAVGDSQQAPHSGQDPRGAAVPGKPAHVLVLSSGGINGAYPAGLLKGWTEAGTRPQFDVVTGVSTGALIAPFAFLGPEHDGDLERIYTSKDAAQVYNRRSILAIPWSDALADSEPLRKRIRAEVTDKLLLKIAQQHRQGRRLFVGTTNLDTRQLVVWDMGAIAAGDDPNKLQLFRDVLLASSSVPGLLPPVPINIAINGENYTELHTDGGISSSLFLLPQMMGVSTMSSASRSGGDASTVYVIVAGKLIPDRVPIEGGVFEVSDASLRGLMQAQMESDLRRVYLLTRYTGARFGLAAIPQDSMAAENSLSGDLQTMRKLFEAGRHSGSAGGVWSDTPPGIAPNEWPTPRAGVSFSQLEGDSR